MGETSDPRVQLEAFFQRRSDEPGRVRVTGYEPINGGYSRMMARVWVEDATGLKGYVVRSDPPPGHSILDTDRSEEWAVLSALHESGSIPLPAPRWFDRTGEELGSPAIVMDMVDAKSLLSLTRESPDTTEHKSLAQRMSALAATVHNYDTSSLPGHLHVPASWDDYIDSRIQKWVDAERAHPAADPFMRLITIWLQANKPPPAPLGLVHGDFQSANVLVQPDGHFLLVDWELTHIGDPREDLGWSACAAVVQPPDVIAADEDSYYARYRELTGLTEEQVNPATIAYFTVLASDSVFVSVTEQLAGVITGQTTGMTIAYMANAVAALHNIFMTAMTRHDAILGGAA